MKRPQIVLSLATSLSVAILSAPGHLFAQPAQPSRIEVRGNTARDAKLIREGAFLSDMHGELRQTQIGVVMDFAPDTKTDNQLVSMVLQRGMTLTAMEQIIAAHDESIGFVISGQVFVYHGRNYLLPTQFSITTEIVNAQTPSADPESESPATTPSPDLPGFDDEETEPSVDDLLKNIDTGVSGSSDLPITLATGNAGSLREGKMIAQVRGRVLPGADGDLIFTRDSDTDPEDPESELPPMQLMPCLNVERLEQLRLEWGDRLIVSMSGRIFVDAGTPVLLPTMYVIELERAGNLTLGQ